MRLSPSECYLTYFEIMPLKCDYRVPQRLQTASDIYYLTSCSEQSFKLDKIGIII